MGVALGVSLHCRECAPLSPGPSCLLPSTTRGRSPALRLPTRHHCHAQIKAYLQQRLGTEQQPAAGAAAGGEAGGGEAGEAGQAASPAQAASPEFVQRLLAEARVPCSDLRVVLRKGAAHLPKDKARARRARQGAG